MKRSLGKLLGIGALALGLSSSPARADAYRYFGTVTDDVTNLPVAGAVVQGSFDNHAVVDTTDSLGGFELNYDTVTGVNEPVIAAFGLSNAFPNPATDGQTTLQLTLPREEHNRLELSLHDISGRRVKTNGGIEQGRLHIDERLPAGVYLLRAAQDGKTLAQEKIVSTRPGLENVVLSTTRGQAQSSLEMTSIPLTVSVAKNGYFSANDTLEIIGDHQQDYDFEPTQRTLNIGFYNVTGTETLDGILIMNIGVEEPVEIPVSGERLIIPYTITHPNDTITFRFLGNGYINGTGALIDPDLPVATGGRIDAAATFGNPSDVITANADDERLYGPVNMQVLADEYFNDQTFRDMMGIIMNRNEAYTTEILSRYMNHSTGAYGGPLPQYYLDDLVTVVEGVQDEYSQPNGTQLIDMNYEITPQFSWVFDNRHLVHGDHIYSIPGNSVMEDESNNLTFAQGWTPTTTTIGTMVEETYNSFLHDVNGNLSLAILGGEIGRLNEFGKTGLALHYLMENGTGCNPR